MHLEDHTFGTRTGSLFGEAGLSNTANAQCAKKYKAVTLANATIVLSNTFRSVLSIVDSEARKRALCAGAWSLS